MCMCGDICCSSCGPAQFEESRRQGNAQQAESNVRCPVCRSWESEGVCCCTEAAKVDMYRRELEDEAQYAKMLEEEEEEGFKDRLAKEDEENRSPLYNDFA